uniref:RNase H type-1 domain-containing protein n=1 Tax=Cannabis sativa TaxID=3483 RepID=A0A803PJ42_CANSA
MASASKFDITKEIRSRRSSSSFAARCGGLGIRRFKDMNLALLAKLFWMVMKEEDKVSVKDLFLGESRVRNERLIRKCFDEEIVDDMLKIKPLHGGLDVLFWKAAKLGIFSIKSAYWISQQHRFKDPSEMWWWINLEDDELKIFTVCVCDTIWKWQNELIFKDKRYEMELNFRDSLSRYNEFSCNCFWYEQVEVTDKNLQRHLYQSKEDFWCCKVDASVIAEEVGFAIFHMNAQVFESWVAVGFSSIYGVMERELSGIALALQMARDKEVSKIMIKIDSKTAATTFGVGLFRLVGAPILCSLFV